MMRRMGWASIGTVAILTVLPLSGCGDTLFVGSDVLWAARHEVGDLSEWMTVAGGAFKVSAPNTIDVSNAHAHTGRLSARMTITTAMNDVQATATLLRAGGLPVEAYYSAWYFLPQPVSVGTFWVIMKFRMRSVADDPGTAGELYDLDLTNLPGGEMSLRLYDHRRGQNVMLTAPDPVVPIARWFHVEAFYRNRQDDTGQLTWWVDDRLLVDIAGQPMAPNAWVGWEASSVAQNLTPNTALRFVVDAAVSRTRVRPTGTLTR
ncbi:MAG: hypothetical protein H7X95_09200 [Deltaproteobacteria bacterium]|nr:hypothetical protein [Deltaproteobacteria bacterium]